MKAKLKTLLELITSIYIHRKIGDTYGYSSVKVAKNHVFAPGYPTHLQLPSMTCTKFKMNCIYFECTYLKLLCLNIQSLKCNSDDFC